MDERGQGPLRLYPDEGAVLAELARIENGTADRRLTSAYRRVLELTRSDDPIDGILAGHLIRDFLVAVAAVADVTGIASAGTRLEYVERIDDLSGLWAGNNRAGEPPAAVVVELRRLLADHDAASERASDPARSVLASRDRGGGGNIPSHSVRRWRNLSHDAAGLAHRLKSFSAPFPTANDGRRLAQELTDTLLAAIGPFLSGIDEIDRLLAVEQPGDEDLERLAALLRTPAQERYFFERAGPQWLRPLANQRHLLLSVSPVIDVGGGQFAIPPWPQGAFLERAAATNPDAVSEVLRRVQPGDNPVVVASMIRAASALPADRARVLVPAIALFLRIRLSLEFAAIEAAKLSKHLAEGGQSTAAIELVMAATKGSSANRRDSEWWIERTLGDPVDAIIAAGGDIGRPLRAHLRKLIRRDRGLRLYSALLIHRVDVPPRYVPRHVWYVANALYRVLVGSELVAAKSLTAELLAASENLLGRIALAAIAQRPELVDAPDVVLRELTRRDDQNGSRYEFRTALRVLWLAASADARDSVLSYAELATEAEAIVGRLEDAPYPDAPAPETVRRAWRSRLLFHIRDLIPPPWAERIGPLDELEEDGIPEPSAEWTRSQSPLSDQELAAMEPAEVIRAMREWRPPQTAGWGAPTVEGLARATSESIASRVAEFRPLAGQISQLSIQVLESVMSALDRSLREDRVDEKRAAVELGLAVAKQFLAHDVTDEWSPEIKRNIAGIVGTAARQSILLESDEDLAVGLLEHLLSDIDPTPESEQRQVEGGYDVGMLALNSVRGAAATAGIEVMLEAVRSEWRSFGQTVADLLRDHAAADTSRSVRAAIGMSLPWLLQHDGEHREEWVSILFGNDVPPDAQRAAWEAYLTYSRYFRQTASYLEQQYGDAVARLSSQARSERIGPIDPDQMLGIHVALAYLGRLPGETTGNWLATFYRNAPDELRGQVTRWMAEQASSNDVDAAIRERARVFLRDRIPALAASTDLAELKSVSWIAPAIDNPIDVLETIVLPALERSGGQADNQRGVADLVARCVVERPRLAATAIEQLVRGDLQRTLPHLAGQDLRTALDVLRTADDESRQISGRVIDLLSERGFFEYRDLLPAP